VAELFTMTTVLDALYKKVPGEDRTFLDALGLSGHITASFGSDIDKAITVLKGFTMLAPPSLRLFIRNEYQDSPLISSLARQHASSWLNTPMPLSVLRYGTDVLVRADVLVYSTSKYCRTQRHYDRTGALNAEAVTLSGGSVGIPAEYEYGRLSCDGLSVHSASSGSTWYRRDRKYHLECTPSAQSILSLTARYRRDSNADIVLAICDEDGSYDGDLTSLLDDCGDGFTTDCEYGEPDPDESTDIEEIVLANVEYTCHGIRHQLGDVEIHNLADRITTLEREAISAARTQP